MKKKPKKPVNWNSERQPIVHRLRGNPKSADWIRQIHRMRRHDERRKEGA